MEDALTTELEFRIDALSPETLSLRRLVAYLEELSRLLGNEPGLHFTGVKPGSAVLAVWGDAQTRPKIKDRLARLRAGDGPPEAAKALNKINEHLREDGASGELSENGCQILYFPGCKLPQDDDIGPVQQPTVVEGQLIRIGGKDKTVHFHLLDGEHVWSGDASRDLARRLGRHLFGSTLRVTGQGSWRRNRDGRWNLAIFHASDFEALDDAPLDAALTALRDMTPNPPDANVWWRDMRGDDAAE